jgi:hypothetical protein
MYKMMFSLQPGNNAVLSGMKAMPIKDSTGDGTAGFAISRHEYAETQTSIPIPVLQQKKWFGSRDASDVISRRRVTEIGVGSLNAKQGAMAFMNKNDNNSRVDALARVRGGGYVVPPKSRNRTNQSGAPLITPRPNVPVVRTEHRIASIPTYKPPGKPYAPFIVRTA